MSDTDAIITQRAATHGKYAELASLSQGLKAMLKTSGRFQNLSCDKRESLEMICMKMARILNGDPNHIDSWEDIAGYAQLVVRNIKGQGI